MFNNNLLLQNAYQDDTLICSTSLDKARVAAKSRALKVCVVGDSISEGADIAFHENTAIGMLEKGLKNSLRYGVDFKNYAIGGTRLQDLVSNIVPNRPWASGRQWIKCVTDFNPDLLVIAFGVNDGATSNQLDFYTNLLRVKSMLLNNLPNTSVVFINNTHTSNTTGNNQDLFTWIAKCQYYFCAQNNYACINANRIFTLVRDGIDKYSYVGRQQPMYVSDNANTWKDAKGIVREFTGSSNKMYFNGPAFLRFHENPQNIKFSTVVNLNNYNSDTTSCVFVARESGLFSHVIGIIFNMTINPNKTVTMSISTGKTDLGKKVTITPNKMFELEIKCIDQVASIIVDKNIVLEVTLPEAVYEGGFYMNIDKGGTGLVFEYPGFQSSRFKTSDKLVSEEFLLGKSGTDFGGNKINHLPDHAFDLIFRNGISKIINAISI
ncbi:SGNH/GDSL hydrolase family protein [Clostridium hydrogeniformans]|uniref:SGNH/GDSL hydrolase family protein n=1 Tax=Clostridium hydrogeniformans TaxID=349933 RepID=UPI0004846A99|nr:SGNH/GDSL hydrolase family protein [Clostridium hydrogeniformans]